VDFFESQDHARKLSRRLVLLFGLAVGSIVVLTYVVVAIAFGISGLWDPLLFVGVAIGTGLLIGGGTAFRTAQLRKGGSAVAELLGGRRVDPSTSDPLERQLMNVVEEMSIASGMSVPAVYVMDRESGINAFAAGHTTHDAAVAVTRGALESFTRDELQGVVAHEFSHILNGDMRLNVRLMGLLFGILLLSVIGRGVLRGGVYGGGGRRRGRNGGGGGQIMLIGFALIVLGYLGVLFGRMIQAAVSRQREFLADAAAVEFTRNPQGIADALKRIGAESTGGRIQDHHAQEASHLFFADGMSSSLSRTLATHPPLPERIRRIDPRWDGNFEVKPARRPRAVEREGEGTGAGAGRQAGGRPGEGKAGRGRRSPFPFPFPFPGMEGAAGAAGGAGAAGFAGAAGAAADSSGEGDAGPSGPAAAPPASPLVAAAGASPEPRHMAWARALLEHIPDGLRTALRTPEGAMAAVLGMLLDEGRSRTGAAGDDAIPDAPSAVRGAQLDRISAALGRETADSADRLGRSAGALGAQARLPLLEIALPALRELGEGQVAALRTLVPALIREDGRVRTFDFALYHVLRRNLFEQGDDDRRTGGNLSLARVRGDVRLLLSAVAHSGSDDPQEVEAAFRTGLSALDGEGEGWTPIEADTLGLDRVDEALARVERASPLARRAILQAAEAIVRADGRIEPSEIEMLRAVAEALDAPMPPMA
jgi:Zn-dependent protease with chaperone function